MFRSIEVDVLSFTYAVVFYIHGPSASLIDKLCRILHAVSYGFLLERKLAAIMSEL